jgi:hypothetical protein
MLEPAALEIGLELLIHVPWQQPPFGRPLISERRIVLRDELIEQRRLGTVPPVAQRRDKSLGLREIVRRRIHGSHPCEALMSIRVGVRLGLGSVLISARDNVLLRESAVGGFCGALPARRPRFVGAADRPGGDAHASSVEILLNQTSSPFCSVLDVLFTVLAFLKNIRRS